jgi:adenylate cyclase
VTADPVETGPARSRSLPGAVASAGILASLLLLRLIDPSPVATMRNLAFDELQRAVPRIIVDPAVTLIDIDDASLRGYGQWPWPRRQLAGMVDRLAESGARLVVLDMVLSEPDRGAAGNDEALAAALRRLPTVGGMALSPEPGPLPPPPAGIAFGGPDPAPHLPAFRGGVAPLAQFRDSFAGWGGLNGLPDADGSYRRFPLLYSAAGQVYPAMVAEILRVLAGDSTYRVKTAGGNGESSLGTDSGIVALRVGQSPGTAFTIPTDATGAIPLRLGQFPRDNVIPAWRLLDGTADRRLIDGHIVLVGASASGLADLHQTALGLRPGTEIAAQALSQILDADYLRRPDWATGMELSLAFLLGGALILSLPKLDATRGAFLLLSWFAVLASVAYAAFRYGHWLFDPGYPALCLGGVYLMVTLDSFRTVERERAFIRRAFARYLSPALVAQLAADPKRLKIGGERRMMTFIFTDIAGFTPMTEKVGPERLAPVINRYFDGVSEVIMRHGGMVNQFVGDAVLAFFNAPTDQPDHAARALACARDLDRFAEQFRRRESVPPIDFGETRIGVHSGYAVVGNFGSSRRFHYGALGDTINVASRIEQLNKFFGTRICISDETLKLSGDQGARPLGEVQVLGTHRFLAIHELLQSEREEEDHVDLYRDAYELLRRGDIAAAAVLFTRAASLAPGDRPTQLHLKRLDEGHFDQRIVMDRK